MCGVCTNSQQVHTSYGWSAGRVDLLWPCCHQHMAAIAWLPHLQASAPNAACVMMERPLARMLFMSLHPSQVIRLRRSGAISCVLCMFYDVELPATSDWLSCCAVRLVFLQSLKATTGPTPLEPSACACLRWVTWFRSASYSHSVSPSASRQPPSTAWKARSTGRPASSSSTISRDPRSIDPFRRVRPERI